MNALLKQVGLNVRQLRKSRGLTQERLAELAGVHPSYIGRLERADINTSLDMIDAIAKALDAPIYLLFIVKSKDKQKELVLNELNHTLSLQSTQKLQMLKRVINEILYKGC